LLRLLLYAGNLTLYIRGTGLAGCLPSADTEKRNTSLLRNSISPSSETDRIDRDVVLLTGTDPEDLRSGRLRTIFASIPRTPVDLFHSPYWLSVSQVPSGTAI